MPEKICIVCGEDCSSKPRTKDARGRYYCTPCYQRAAKPRKSSTASVGAGASGLLPPESSDDLDWLKDALPAGSGGGGLPCPGCGAPLDSGAVLCMSCGYNMQTGSTLQVKTYAAPKERRVPSFASGALMHPAMGFIAALATYGIFAAVAVSSGEGGMLAFAGWHGIYSLIIAIVVLVAAFRESIAQGFLTLCVPFYVLYFVFAVADSSWVRWLYGANLLGVVIFIGVTANMSDSLAAY